MCEVVISGYSAKYRYVIIKRWQELEESVKALPSASTNSLQDVNFRKFGASLIDRWHEHDEGIASLKKPGVGEILCRHIKDSLAPFKGGLAAA